MKVTKYFSIRRNTNFFGNIKQNIQETDTQEWVDFMVERFKLILYYFDCVEDTLNGRKMNRESHMRSDSFHENLSMCQTYIHELILTTNTKMMHQLGLLTELKLKIYMIKALCDGEAWYRHRDYLNG